MDHANRSWTTYAALSIVATGVLPMACNLPDADVGELSSGSTPMESGSVPDDGDDGDAGASASDSGDGGGTSGGGTAASNGGDGPTTDDGPGTDGGDGPATGGSDTSSDTDEAGTDGPPQDVCCVGGLLSWGFVGSILKSSTASEIDDCNAFVRFDDNNTMDDTPPVACFSQLVCQTDAAAIGTAHITSFLADPQFQAVIAEGTEFYGVNGAPIDIPNFHFDLDGVDIGIGGLPCTKPTDGPLSCIPVPPVIAEFADLLEALTLQQGDQCPK